MTYDENGMPYGNQDHGFMNQLADPRFQGLATLASGLLQQSGWQPQRVGLGQAFGGAGLQALQAMQKARAYQLQLADAMQNRALHGLQMQHLQGQLMNEAQANQEFTNWQNSMGAGGAMPSPIPVNAPSLPSIGDNLGQSQMQPQGQAMPQATQAPPPPIKPWDALNKQADVWEQNLRAVGPNGPVYRSKPVVEAAEKDIATLRARADRLQTMTRQDESGQTTLGKLQNERKVLATAYGETHPLVQQYDDKIQKEISNRENSTQYERSTQGLTGLLGKKSRGEPLTQQDYIDALGWQAAIESTSRAVQDPNTGQVTFISNAVPDPYSVKALFGNAPQTPGKQGATTRFGNQNVTVVPGPGARPAEAEIKVLSEGDALRGILADTRQLFNPKWVGPLAGRVGDIKQQYIGQDEPGRAEFIAKSNQYKNRLIKFITGAQMSEVETKRLINEIPGPLDPPSTYEAKLKTSNDNIDYVMRAYQQNMKQGNIRPVGGNPVSPSQVEVKQPAPNAVTKPTPLTNTWEDNQYQYRQLPDGSVQRKKK